MRAAPYIRDLWRVFNTPDNFANDPYGAATNQIAHTFLGMFAVQMYCDGYFVIFGEMPFRAPVALAVMAVYVVVIEVWAQRIKRRIMSSPNVIWDSIMDTLFFALGVAGVLLPLWEIEARGAVSFLERRPMIGLAIGAAWLAVFVPYVFSRIPRGIDAR